MTPHAALTIPSYRSPIAIPNPRLNDRSVSPTLGDLRRERNRAAASFI
jgi:hypothetical protein